MLFNSHTSIYALLIHHNQSKGDKKDLKIIQADLKGAKGNLICLVLVGVGLIFGFCLRGFGGGLWVFLFGFLYVHLGFSF